MSVGIEGSRSSGAEVRKANLTAIQALANIVRSSLGPCGLDKMLVDKIGEVIVTNDGATILSKLEVKHPAAKILVDLSRLQDEEVGDGTTSVVLLAASLLAEASKLLERGVHAAIVCQGFRLASREAVRFINGRVSVPVADAGVLLSVARTTISSKLISVETDHFADLIVRAVQSVRSETVFGGRTVVRHPVEEVNVLVATGAAAHDSTLFDGYILPMGRAALQMPEKLSNVKIAIVDFNLRQHRMQMGVNVAINAPGELEQVRKWEKDAAATAVRAILDAGATLVLCLQGMDDMCMKYLTARGAIGVRRVTPEDARRIARITGATVVKSLADEEGTVSFDPAWLGSCQEVWDEPVGGWDRLWLRGCKQHCTLLLRGPNEYVLEEAKRSVHDALCAVARVCDHAAVCPGAGAVEAALHAHLGRHFRAKHAAGALGARALAATQAFATALLAIPIALAANANQPTPRALALLKAHYAEDPAVTHGLCVETGQLLDCMQRGILEATVSKTKSLKFATEAATTILRIDDHIQLDKKEDPNQARR